MFLFHGVKNKKLTHFALNNFHRKTKEQCTNIFIVSVMIGDLMKNKNIQVEVDKFIPEYKKNLHYMVKSHLSR